MFRPAAFARGFWFLLVLAVPAFGAGSTTSEKRFFDIPAGEAAAQLTEWGRQSGFDIVVHPDRVRGLRTNAVHGAYEPLDALSRLIAGTGLRVEHLGKGKVAVSGVPAKPAPKATGDAPGAGVRGTPGLRRTTTTSSRLSAPPDELVVISGTRLRERAPTGAHRISLSRRDIEAAGHSTAAQAIQTLPQVFGGGPSEDAFNAGIEASTNSGRGIGINIRGLDAGSTLVLINGRRLAPGGSEGAFIDFSNFPLNAIRRIDVIADASSAIYGANAVGGVVDVVMREGFAGSETQARLGAGDDGAFEEYQLGHLTGARWARGSALLALELYERGALGASERVQASGDLRALGGEDLRSPMSNPGTIEIGGQTWAIPAGQDGRALTPEDLLPGTQNRYDEAKLADILPHQRRWSAYANVRQELGAHSLFADLLVSRREAEARSTPVSSQLPVPESNPFYINPTGGHGPVHVGYSFGDDFGPQHGVADVRTVNATVGARLWRDRAWETTGTVGYGFEGQHLVVNNAVDFTALSLALADPDPATAFNPFGDGSHTSAATLAKIRTQSTLRTQSAITSASLVTAGPAWRTWGGDATLTLGVDVYRQSFTARVARMASEPARHVSAHRDAGGLFGELVLPLIDERAGFRFARALELSAALRYEHFSDFGGALAPRAGISFRPWNGLTLRGTWAESIRAPNLSDLVETQNASTIALLPDADGLVPALIWSGRNAGLQEERARSWSFGVDLSPREWPGFLLGLTYFDVQFRNRIHAVAADPLRLLSDPLYEALVTRNPGAMERREVCERSLFNGPPEACIASPLAAVVDLRLRNGAALYTKGIDLFARHELDTSFGRFEIETLGTYVLSYSAAGQAGEPLQEMVGRQHYPIDLRLRGALKWEKGAWAAGVFLNYADNYRDVAGANERRIPSWTTTDIALSCTAGRSAASSQTRYSLRVENAFNRYPPLVMNRIGAIGYDPENADLTGRIVSLHVRRSW